jgi:hypothetical protein
MRNFAEEAFFLASKVDHPKSCNSTVGCELDVSLHGARIPKTWNLEVPKVDAPRPRPDLEATHLVDGMFGSPVAQDSGPSVREKLAESCLMLPF